VIETSKIKQRWWPWLLAGLAAVAAAFLFDNRVDAALDATHEPALHKVAWWCSKLGEGWVPAAVGLCFAAAFFLLNRPSVAARIFFVVLTCELTGLAVVILRPFFGRARPGNHDVPPGFYGLWHDGHWIAGQFKFSSFPSGHAATAVGVAAAAWLVQRGWGALLAVYAVAVMWSRLALQAHHLSDVLASTVLAITLAVWMKPFLLTSIEFQFGNLHRAWRKK
jgi:membrane-associated phospholipid phosphatase